MARVDYYNDPSAPHEQDVASAEALGCESWSSATPVHMPAVGVYAPDATITEWMKYVGDVVDIDEPLFEAENDIITIQVPSSASGILVEITAKENTLVEAGAVVALIL